MASKKSIYSSLLLLTLTLGAFVPVTSFADDGIATNDAVLTQPTTDRATTGPSTAPSDGDLARSNSVLCKSIFFEYFHCIICLKIF